MIKATCVLIEKGSKYPQEILDSLPEFDEVLIKTESPSVYERYILASKARNEIVYVQDSDCLTDVNKLWKHYNGRLTNGITAHHQAYYISTGVTLVGWGCFFPKKMLKSFSKYVDKYGVDAHLLREADRIFTYLNQPHNTIIMNHLDLEQTPDKMSFEPEHYISAQQAIEKCKLLNSMLY